MQGKEAVRATLDQIDIVHRMMRRWPETFATARTAAEVERVFKSGKIASMIGMEGGHSIDNSLATLRMMHALGAGYMTLTHSANVPWADSATDKPGARRPVEIRRRSRARDELARHARRSLPRVARHDGRRDPRQRSAGHLLALVGQRAICNVPRNVPDNILQMLPKNGGVVMITFVPGFISQQVADHGTKSAAQQQSLRAQFPNNEAQVSAAMERWRAENPEPRATLTQVADHIDHVRKVAGIDHIGLGGDFDGITAVVQGLEDVSKYPDLTAELLKRGYTDQDVKKILGLNILRVMREAERVSGELRKKRGPSTATIEQMDAKGTQ